MAFFFRIEFYQRDAVSVRGHKSIVRPWLAGWFLVWLPWAPLPAQPVLTALLQDGSQLQFRNELNSYLWQWNLGKQLQIAPRLTFSFAEGFRSSMLKLSNEKKWKDDQSLAAGLLYGLSAPWQLALTMQSFSFLDRQTGLNADIHTHSARLGVHYLPSPRLQIKFDAGPKWDYRFQRKDNGLTCSADAAAQDFDVQSYRNSFSLALNEDLFDQRRNSNRNAIYRVSRSFTQDTADTLRFYASNRRNDNYTSASGDFESLRETNKGLQNALGYQMAPLMRLWLTSELQFRDVEVASYAAEQKQKSRQRHDQQAGNSLILHTHGRRWYSQSQLSYESLTQKYDIDVNDLKVPFSQRTAFITPNNSSQRLTLGSEFGSRLSRVDSLNVYGSMSRFRYDTPDTNNFDDRDEFRGHLRGMIRHVFSPVLLLDVQSSVNLYHMVYIFGERSADNNWNRILRLRPGLYYTPTRTLRLYQSFEVLANYVDYDFDSAQQSTKSYVFRKFSMDDSLRWQFADRTSWALDYRLQLEENGQLYWQKWSERVLTTRRSHWFQARLHHSNRAGLSLSPGFTVYLREEWRHDQNEHGVEIKKSAGTFCSYGPMLRVTYAPSAAAQVTFDGIRRRVNPAGQAFYYINDLDVQVEWHF
jgi:hypothetical protein